MSLFIVFCFFCFVLLKKNNIHMFMYVEQFIVFFIICVVVFVFGVDWFFSFTCSSMYIHIFLFLTIDKNLHFYTVFFLLYPPRLFDRFYYNKQKKNISLNICLFYLNKKKNWSFFLYKTWSFLRVSFFI